MDGIQCTADVAVMGNKQLSQPAALVAVTHRHHLLHGALDVIITCNIVTSSLITWDLINSLIYLFKCTKWGKNLYPAKSITVSIIQCCPWEKSLSLRITEDQFTSPWPCPWTLSLDLKSLSLSSDHKSSKIVENSAFCKQPIMYDHVIKSINLVTATVREVMVKNSLLNDIRYILVSKPFSTVTQLQYYNPCLMKFLQQI